MAGYGISVGLAKDSDLRIGSDLTKLTLTNFL
jgi:hypothetical protein